MNELGLGAAIGAFVLCAAAMLLIVGSDGAKEDIANRCELVGVFLVEGNAYTCERKEP